MTQIDDNEDDAVPSNPQRAAERVCAVPVPRRLQKVAKVCEDFGIRVQYSIFECHLDERRFERFWTLLNAEIDPEEDRIVAYQIDAKSARKTRTAGTMVCSEKVVVYLV